jgi:hypothetical protein
VECCAPWCLALACWDAAPWGPTIRRAALHYLARRRGSGVAQDYVRVCAPRRLAATVALSPRVVAFPAGRSLVVGAVRWSFIPLWHAPGAPRGDSCSPGWLAFPSGWRSLAAGAPYWRARPRPWRHRISDAPGALRAPHGKQAEHEPSPFLGQSRATCHT